VLSIESTMMLKHLSVGDNAKISGFNPTGKAYRRKLLSMGLTPGTPITVVRLAPMGDPVEIRVRGSALSLRKDEADALEVEKI
jgi:ferrous iron transport protein A